jgi:hypothetical protein
MLQGLETWHRRIAMSNTSGLRSHAVYTGEKSFDPSAIILGILDFRLRLRTVSEAEKLFITRLGNKMCSNQDIRSLREWRKFAKPARKNAHRDPVVNAVELAAEHLRVVSNCQRNSNARASRGSGDGCSETAWLRGLRSSAGATPGFAVAVTVPKNTLRAFSNDSSVIGFLVFISVF